MATQWRTTPTLFLLLHLLAVLQVGSLRPGIASEPFQRCVALGRAGGRLGRHLQAPWHARRNGIRARMGAGAELQLGGPAKAPRLAAIEILAVGDGRRIEMALAGQQGGLASMSRADRSFVRAMVATVLRRQGQIDAVLGTFMQVYPPRGSKRVISHATAALRLGVAQLLFLDVPPHAAVAETVEACKHPDLGVPPKLVPVVNAVLRRVSRDGEAALSISSVLENVAPEISERLVRAYGEATTVQIVNAMMCEPTLDLTVRTGRVHDIDALARSLNATRLPVPTGLRRPTFQGVGPISRLPGFEEGLWWVQDAAASLPARVLASSGLVPRGSHVVDMCGAPGGKTAQLLDMGYAVTAVEVDKRRARRLAENLDRLGLNNDDNIGSSEPVPGQCRTAVCDGLSFVPESIGEASVVGVLLDAPCSATGTGRRRPDVLRKSLDGLGDLVEVQRDLALHCAEHVLSPMGQFGSGGVLVYATCSILPEECEDQARDLPELARTRGLNVSLRPLPIKPAEVPGFQHCITPEGWVRVLPGGGRGGRKGVAVEPGAVAARGGENTTNTSEDGCWCDGDGFFVARFVIVREV